MKPGPDREKMERGPEVKTWTVFFSNLDRTEPEKSKPGPEKIKPGTGLDQTGTSLICVLHVEPENSLTTAM